MTSTRWGPGAATALELRSQLQPRPKILGQPPQTLNLPVFDAPQEAFIIASGRTPEGQRLLGNRRKLGRVLAIASLLLCIAGVMAEIACILAAVSGAQQAAKLNWPLANTPPSWDGCEYLPNSDAPATSYGAGIAVLYHSMNVAVFGGLLSFFMRYAKHPKAKYSISAAGLFQFWLGLGLASRWLGTLQVVAGVLLMVIGLLDFWFGFHYFQKAAAMAFVPIHILHARAEKEEHAADEKLREEEAKEEANKDPDVWRGTVEQAMKQLQAYRPAEA